MLCSFLFQGLCFQFWIYFLNLNDGSVKQVTCIIIIIIAEVLENSDVTSDFEHALNVDVVYWCINL